MSGRYKILLVLVVALAVGVSGVSARQRYLVEKSNKTVEVAVDYSQVWDLARRENMPLKDVLLDFKQAGVTAVLFKEQLPEDLYQQGLAYSKKGIEIQNDTAFAGIGSDVRSYIHADYTYLITADPEVYERLERQLSAKLQGVQALPDADAGVYLVGIPVLPETEEQTGLGLGFPEAGLAAAQEAGLDVIPQLRSWPEATEESLKVVFGELKNIPNLSELAFNDGRVPGYPGLLSTLEEETKDLGAPVTLIEFFPQAGLDELVRSTGKNAVRLHSITAEEMQNISPQTALDRYTLAVNERNVRVIFARLFEQQGSGDWLTTNVDFFNSLKSDLQAKGFSLGVARPFASFPASRANMGLIGLGVIAGALLLLEEVGLRRRYALLLGAVGLAGWGGLLVLDLSLAQKLMSLSAVIVFPTLAVVSTVQPESSGLVRSVLKVLRAVVISLAGALLMVGLLPGTGYMLQIDQFSGVKVGMLVPLLLIPVFLVMKNDRTNFLKVANDFLGRFVEYKWLLVLGVLAGVAVLLVLRSGNDAGLVSGLEIKARTLLNHVLVVRPRTKEFLVGYPFLLLTYYFGYRHRLLPAAILGSVGQVSLVNTFEHLHTPLVISIVRTVNGVWVGILIGLVLIAAVKILLRMLGTREKSFYA